MKKFEASIIYAFTPVDGNDKAHGNPALVVFGEPSKEEMETISQQARVELNNEMIELPIIDFINPVDIEKNIFDIKYYFCTGMRISVCGHGTIAATKAIMEKYRKKNVKQNFTFNLDQNFEENREFPSLNIETDGNYFKTEFDEVEMTSIAKEDEVFKIIKKNLPDIIDSTVYKTPLRDYICVHSDAKKLRETIIGLDELKRFRKIDSIYRALIVVAKSDIDGYDYETTVFSDGLPAPVYKDPACGSANKEMLKLIRVSNLFPERFKKGDVENFRMFYPYRFNELGIMGGIQDVEYQYKKGKVFVKSGTTFGKNLTIKIDSGKISFE